MIGRPHREPAGELGGVDTHPCHPLARALATSRVSFDYQLDVNAAKALIKRAYEAGINFFDNAEVYALGKSEIIMGQALAELDIPRSDIIITTKIFHGTTRDPEPTARGLSRKHVIEGVRASLQRLHLSYVDVVFAHRPDDTVPMEEIVRAFDFVVNQGWAFYWGVSEWSPEQITAAFEEADRLGLIAPIAEQPHYNMYESLNSLTLLLYHTFLTCILCSIVRQAASKALRARPETTHRDAWPWPDDLESAGLWVAFR